MKESPRIKNVKSYTTLKEISPSPKWRNSKRNLLTLTHNSQSLKKNMFNAGEAQTSARLKPPLKPGYEQRLQRMLDHSDNQLASLKEEYDIIKKQ